MTPTRLRVLRAAVTVLSAPAAPAAQNLVVTNAAIRTGTRTGPELVPAGPTLNSESPAPFHRKVSTDAEARAAHAGVPIITGTDVLDRHGEMLRRSLCSTRIR